jgi:XRE family transcriptional regulator, regulator of sulfur utilization
MPYQTAMPVKSAPEIGPILHQRRKALGLTLVQLSTRSGVSKSMLSEIERAEANPTYAVLWALTSAMRIDFAALLKGTTLMGGDERIDITRVEHTPEIRSADGLCRLRILSPPELIGSVEWYSLEFAPGGRLESKAHSPGATEHFTAETTGIELTTASTTRAVEAGETAHYPADVPHVIANVSRETSRGYLVALYDRRIRKGGA